MCFLDRDDTKHIKGDKTGEIAEQITHQFLLVFIMGKFLDYIKKYNVIKLEKLSRKLFIKFY